ncbi:ATP-binding protein [Candidatus Nomurabacteria bacterium]|nr:ATP-binding protein [Candidatus Nomurabacteria bacterium]
MYKKPIYIKRKIDTKIQEYLKYPEILAVIGPRQAGKTTYLKHLIDERKGLFISFEDRDILALFNNDIKKFVDKFIITNKLVCIDEFQYAKDGGKNLKFIFDTNPNTKIIISGSSAIDLTIHSLKFLVGRVIAINFWPFDKDELQTVFPHLKEEEIFDYYAKFGGYPRVAIAKDDDERKLVLKNIYNTYFLREVKDILGLVDEYRIQKLLVYMAQSVGSTINYAKIANTCDLKERDIRKYMEFMNKTFITYLSLPFYTNKLLEIVKQPKIYFFDSGFLNFILSFEVSDGKKLEQVVAMELIKKEFNFKYWRDKRKNEMDFVVYKDNKIVGAIEAKSGGKISKSFRIFANKYKEIRTNLVTYGNLNKIINDL